MPSSVPATETVVTVRTTSHARLEATLTRVTRGGGPMR
jgi:hypothetical protein